MAGKPKDHYVPQFYLDAFSSDKNPYTPHIFQYSQESIVPAAIKDIAAEKDFYTFTNKKDSTTSRDIDEFHTMIEGKVGAAIKDIIRTEEINCDDDQKQMIAVFIALLAVRTPGFVKAMEAIRAEGMKEFMAMNAMDKSVFKKQSEEAGIILNAKELEEHRQFVLNKEYSVEFKEARAFFLAQGIELSMELADGYYRSKHWHLVINPTWKVFVTSDNPISIYRPTYIPPIYNAGLGNGTIFLPLSPRIGLLLRDLPLSKSKFEITSEKKIDYINSNTMGFSNNYIYGNLKSKKILSSYQRVGNKQFQEIKPARAKWAPYTFFMTNPVPEEFLS